MKILSVVLGIPPKNSAQWLRIKKQMDILSTLGNDVEICFYAREGKNLQFNPPFEYSLINVSPVNVHFKHFLKVLDNNYNLVFCNLSKTSFISSLSKIKGVPLILDNHGDSVSERQLLFNPGILESLYHKVLSFLSFRLSDRIICVSTSMIKDLKERGIPEEKLYYVTNATDLDFFKPLEKDEINETKMNLGLTDKLTFGYIGSGERWQGLDNLIKASKIMEDNDIFFLFAGFSKNEKRTYNSLFLPRVPREEVKFYYGVCDVLVLPRPYHKATEVAAPTKFAEYAAMGKPILTTNVGDAAGLVRKYNCGIVVDDNSPKNLLMGIRKFKSLPKRELLEMGENSRKMAEKEFSMEKMKQDLKKVIESL
ncbi:MAG: glycosyltransferase family 4 protein [Candidatus Methanofastidiosum sp.]|nr:glycosyltransferase family 4 protein [Methanofastidiosum sp.]